MKRQIVITGWQSKVLTALYEEDILDDNDINIIENNIKDKDDFER